MSRKEWASGPRRGKYQFQFMKVGDSEYFKFDRTGCVGWESPRNYKSIYQAVMRITKIHGFEFSFKSDYEGTLITRVK